MKYFQKFNHVIFDAKPSFFEKKIEKTTKKSFVNIFLNNLREHMKI